MFKTSPSCFKSRKAIIKFTMYINKISSVAKKWQFTEKAGKLRNSASIIFYDLSRAVFVDCKWGIFFKCTQKINNVYMYN